MNSELLGSVLTKSVTYKIEIRKIDVVSGKEVPLEEVENLKEWLIYKALEVGTGRQHEYYSYTDDYKDDIGVDFYVGFESNK